MGAFVNCNSENSEKVSNLTQRAPQQKNENREECGRAKTERQNRTVK
jgi:hypothetical protein